MRVVIAVALVLVGVASAAAQSTTIDTGPATSTTVTLPPDRQTKLHNSRHRARTLLHKLCNPPRQRSSRLPNTDRSAFSAVVSGARSDPALASRTAYIDRGSPHAQCIGGISCK